MKTNETPSVGGIFTFTHVRNGEVIDSWEQRNLVLNAGLDHLLDVTFHGTTAISPWYIGLYSNTYTPDAGDTSADLGVSYTQITTQYDEATRPEYEEAAAAAQVTTNTLNRAVFTFNTGVNVAGAFLISDNVKTNATGMMIAASAHSPSRAMLALDELLVKYEFTASST